VTAPNMSQRGGKLGPMDEMDDDEFGVVDLDAVDDDRDVDTDAATATTRPEEPRRRIDESVKLPQSPRRAVSLPASVAPVARGAAIGAGVAVGANAVRKHPKTALAVAALGAAILATPPEKRPELLKRMGIACNTGRAVGADEHLVVPVGCAVRTLTAAFLNSNGLSVGADVPDMGIQTRIGTASRLLPAVTEVT